MSEHISILNGAINSHFTFLVSDDVGEHFYAEWCHQLSLYISGFRWRRSTFLCWMVPSTLTLHFWFQMTSEHISMLNGAINSHCKFLVSDDVGTHFYAEWCHQFSLYISGFRWRRSTFLCWMVPSTLTLHFWFQMTSEHISMLNGAINSHSTFLVSDDIRTHFYAEWCHQLSLYISGFRWRQNTFLCWMVPSTLTLHFWFQMTSEHISMLNGAINSHSTFLVSDDVRTHFYAEWCHQLSLYISGFRWHQNTFLCWMVPSTLTLHFWFQMTSEHISMLNGAINSHCTFLVSDDVRTHFYAEWCHQFSLYISGFRWRRNTFLCWMVPSILIVHFWFQMTWEHISMLNGAINSHSTFLVSDDVRSHFYAEWCHQLSLYISGFRWRRSTFLCWMVPSTLTLHFWFQMTSEHISMLNGAINSHSTFLVLDDVGTHFYAEWCHQLSLYISGFRWRRSTFLCWMVPSVHTPHFWFQMTPENISMLNGAISSHSTFLKKSMETSMKKVTQKWCATFTFADVCV